jgi:tetratricopeptide (TPR) repeat protein
MVCTSRFACILNAVFSIAAMLLFASCRPADHARTPSLVAVTLPDLSRVDEPVRVQIRETHAALMQAMSRGPADRHLGTMFGEYGMLLQAAEYPDAAEPAYLNAQMLAGDDPRWPYHLAHVYRYRGDTEGAVRALRRVLELRPDSVPALIWLGRVSFDRGDIDAAAMLFSRAQMLAPQAVAARVGLGQVAIARADYRKAVDEFESALAADPSVASVYAPLAVAYRALGDSEQAAALQKQWRNTEVPVPDPFRMELDTLLESALSYEVRGVRALDQRDFPGAEQLFRRGLALAAPGSQLSRSLRHKLGTALALRGDTAHAVQEFEATVRDAPAGAFNEPAAKASYSLGVLAASSGDAAAAVRRLDDALRYNPNYFEAHLVLADVLRASGRFGDARRHYEQSLHLNPRSAQARDGLAQAAERRRTP